MSSLRRKERVSTEVGPWPWGTVDGSPMQTRQKAEQPGVDLTHPVLPPIAPVLISKEKGLARLA